MAMTIITRRGIGGQGCNISVRSYATQDSLPNGVSKNTISVITDIEIANVYIQSEMPVPTFSMDGSSTDINVGDVWVATNTVSGNTALDISNLYAHVELDIECVMQYDGEKWVRMEAYAFIDGAWILISAPRLYLYDRGVQSTEITGSWASKKDSNGVITWDTDHLYIGYTGSKGRYASVYTTQAIDMSGYSKLVVVVSNTTGSGTGSVGICTSAYTGVNGGTGKDSMTAWVGIPSGLTEETAYELDISSIDGSYIIQLIAPIICVDFYEIYLY